MCSFKFDPNLYFLLKIFPYLPKKRLLYIKVLLLNTIQATLDLRVRATLDLRPRPTPQRLYLSREPRVKLRKMYGPVYTRAKSQTAASSTPTCLPTLHPPHLSQPAYPIPTTHTSQPAYPTPPTRPTLHLPRRAAPTGPTLYLPTRLPYTSPQPKAVPAKSASHPAYPIPPPATKAQPARPSPSPEGLPKQPTLYLIVHTTGNPPNSPTLYLRPTGKRQRHPRPGPSCPPPPLQKPPRVLPVRLACVVASGLSLGNLGEEGLTLSRS